MNNFVLQINSVYSLWIRYYRICFTFVETVPKWKKVTFLNHSVVCIMPFRFLCYVFVYYCLVFDCSFSKSKFRLATHPGSPMLCWLGQQDIAVHYPVFVLFAVFHCMSLCSEDCDRDCVFLKLSLMSIVLSSLSRH